MVCFGNINNGIGKMNDFKRIMLKLSGEALGGVDGDGLDPQVLRRVAGEIAAVVKSGKQVAVVIGAGNFFRGATDITDGIDRVTGDQIGMLATLMNSLALRDYLFREDTKAVVLSAFETGPVAGRYTPMSGRKMLDRNKVTICAGGTGNPYFTTDTAAVLRALELKCDAMFKASKVDGVYDSDPVRNPDAKRFDTITYQEVIERGLGVMDLTAVTLAAGNKLPVVVFNMQEEGILPEVARGLLKLGTLISG